VEFRVDPRQMSLVNADGTRAVQPGSYRIFVGGVQPAAPQQAGAAFEITGALPLAP